MPSQLIGRTTCPECGFESAHVKRAEGEGKRPYRYCPECGSQFFPKSDAQGAALLAKTRATAAPPAPTPPAPQAPPEPVKKKPATSFLDGLL